VNNAATSRSLLYADALEMMIAGGTRVLLAADNEQPSLTLTQVGTTNEATLSSANLLITDSSSNNVEITASTMSLSGVGSVIAADISIPRMSVGDGLGTEAALWNGYATASLPPTADDHLTRRDYVDGLVTPLQDKTQNQTGISGETTFSGTLLVATITNPSASTGFSTEAIGGDNTVKATSVLGSGGDVILTHDANKVVKIIDSSILDNATLSITKGTSNTIVTGEQVALNDGAGSSHVITALGGDINDASAYLSYNSISIAQTEGVKTTTMLAGSITFGDSGVNSISVNSVIPNIIVSGATGNTTITPGSINANTGFFFGSVPLYSVQYDATSDQMSLADGASAAVYTLQSTGGNVNDGTNTLGYDATQLILTAGANNTTVTAGSVTASLPPTAADHLTRKDYVDSVAIPAITVQAASGTIALTPAMNRSTYILTGTTATQTFDPAGLAGVPAGWCVYLRNGNNATGTTQDISISITGVVGSVPLHTITGTTNSGGMLLYWNGAVLTRYR
jgi:hypothetical protein